MLIEWLSSHEKSPAYLDVGPQFAVVTGPAHAMAVVNSPTHKIVVHGPAHNMAIVHLTAYYTYTY